MSGAPGEIARVRGRPLVLRFAPDRCRGRQRPTWPNTAKLSNSACLSAGSSNWVVQRWEPDQGSRAEQCLVRPERLLAAGRRSASASLRPAAAARRRPTSPAAKFRYTACRTPLGLRPREFEFRATSSSYQIAVLGAKNIGAPGEIVRGYAANPPLRCGPPPRAARQRPTRRRRRVVELPWAFGPGSSNYNVGLQEPTKSSRARMTVVRPERFELPASWFVARRSIQLSYGRMSTQNHTICGGEGGIRTLDGLLTHTPLAGARLRPLGHLSRRAIAPISRSAG